MAIDEVEKHTCEMCQCNDATIEDEGDVWWCRECIEEWEEKNHCNWEDGMPIITPSNFEKVGQFNDACGCHREAKPNGVPIGVAQMRYELIREELEEYKTALVKNDVVGIADALADLLYVVYGAAHTHGIDIQPVFDEVHRSNMAKVGPDGKVIRRADGKILKPEGWTKPDIAGVLAQQMEAVAK